VDESDKLKQQVQEEEERRQMMDVEVRKVMEQLRVIDSVLHSFCTKLEVNGNNIHIRIILLCSYQHIKRYQKLKALIKLTS
jgi:hypothetical protein